MVAVLRQVIRGLNVFEQGFIFATLSLMLIFVFSAVIFRYFLHIPIAWLEEASRYCLIATVFIGASVVTQQKNDIKVGVLPLIVRPEKSRNFVLWSIDIIGLALSAYFAYLTYGYMRSIWAMPAISPALNIHTGWIRSMPFVGSVLWSLNLLIIIVKDGIGLMKKR